MISRRDSQILPPADCQRWCALQDPNVMVEDEMVRIDLDWWKRELSKHENPVVMVARDPEGREVTDGVGTLRRGDLVDLTALKVVGPERLVRLYRCAAWLYEHPRRGRARRFPDVRDAKVRSDPFKVIETALRQCEQTPNLFDAGPFREWSGWPKAPSIGRQVLSLYSWAVHSGATQRPQLLDQNAIAMLIRSGWVGPSAAQGYTPRDYQRYCDLLHGWAEHADVRPELIELWLVREWSRLAEKPWADPVAS